MSNHVRIGVFLPASAQLLDIATVDVLATISKEYLSVVPFIPKDLAATAPNVSVAHIATPAHQGSVETTSNTTLRATHDYTDAAVAPGQLDVVVVPGPSPSATFDGEALRWLRRQAGTPGVDVLSVCTGVYVCAAAGIADGRKVSGPRGTQGLLREKFPGIELVGDKYRWVRDGNLWSSGGVTNGNDLMAAYARESPRWENKDLVEIGLSITDVGDRGQFYPQD